MTLTLLNPNDVPSALKTFRNDQLYFIQFVQYMPKGRAHDKLFKQRAAAVTPQALFITDTEAKMDRAVRLESLRGFNWFATSRKKLLFEEQIFSAVIKVLNEADIYIQFIGSDAKEVGKRFAQILLTAAKVKNTVLSTTECKTIEELDKEFNGENPKGFMTPQEIIQQNESRKNIVNNITWTDQTIEKLRPKLEGLKRKNAEKEELVQPLREACNAKSSDQQNAAANKYKEANETTKLRHAALRKTFVSIEVDVLKLRDEVSQMEETLESEKNHFEALVAAQVAETGEEDDEKESEMDAVVERGRAREVKKSEERQNALKDLLSEPPTYSGPPAQVEKAKELEEKVRKAVDKYEKALFQEHKLEGIFEVSVEDLRAINDDMFIVYEKKVALLNERRKKIQEAEEAEAAQTAAEAAEAAAANDDDLLGDDIGGGTGGDDDLLGDGDDGGNDAGAGGDDDLLGGGDVAPGGEDLLGGGGDDDDLLGGPPPPAPAADDDDLLA